MEETVNVTARVAAQLRFLGDFDVAVFGPRTEVSTEGWIMNANSLELLRLALVGVLCVGLLPDVVADRPCLDRVSVLSAVFTATSDDLRTHTLINYSILSTATARSVMGDMVNHDIRLWVNGLVRFSLGIQPAVVPPPPDMVF